MSDLPTSSEFLYLCNAPEAMSIFSKEIYKNIRRVQVDFHMKLNGVLYITNAWCSWIRMIFAEHE